MSVMAMSISGAVLILVILAVRDGLKDRLPKRTFAVLWTVALVRLLIPFSVPSSWSAYTLLQNAVPETGQMHDLTNLISGNVPVGENASGSAAASQASGTGGAEDIGKRSETGAAGNTGELPGAVGDREIGERSAQGAGQQGEGLGLQAALENGLSGSSGQGLQSEIEIGSQPDPLSNPQSAGQTDSFTFSGDVSEGAFLPMERLAEILPVLKAIWAAGVLLCAMAFAWIYFRCCREFRMSLPFKDRFLESWRGSHPLWRKLSIRQSDQILSPLSYGVWHPVILLPKSTKCGDRFQLRYVLEHEYVHIRYFDAAVKLLMAAALCMHWFNPCVYLMYIFFNRDLELACDEAVVRRFGEEEKSAYAMALIEMEEEKSGLLPLGNSFSKNAIEERIGAIMKMKKMPPFVHGLSAALVCGIILLFATSCGSYGEAEKNREAGPQAETVDVEETNANNSISTKSLSAALKESKQGGEAIRQSAMELTTEEGRDSGNHPFTLNVAEESKDRETQQSAPDSDKNKGGSGSLQAQKTPTIDESIAGYSRKELADRLADLDKAIKEKENELERIDGLYLELQDFENERDLLINQNHDRDIEAKAGQENVLQEREENEKQIAIWEKKIEEQEKDVEQFYSNLDAFYQEIEEMEEEKERLQFMESELEQEAFFEEHYGKYGIRYDPVKGTLYKGKTTVRFFIDDEEGGVLWADNGGEVIVRAVYDNEGKINGVSVRKAEEDQEEASTKETEKIKAAEAAAEDVERAVRKKAEAEAAKQAEKAAEEAEDSYHSAAYVISIGEEFEEYEKFGLSYDKKSDFLMYKNETVGYFKDETKPNVYTRLIEDSGKLAIIVNRDKSGKITDFSVSPFDESSLSDAPVNESTAVKEGSGIIRWDESGDVVSIVSFPNEERGDLEAYAEEQEDVVAAAEQEETGTTAEQEAAGEAAEQEAAEQGTAAEAEATAGEAAYSEGDPNEKETSLPKEYEKLGIKISNEKKNQWTYQGKGVAVIYDKDHWIYANDSIPEKEAVYLEVVRDKKDRVTALNKVSKKEMQKLMDGK